MPFELATPWMLLLLPLSLLPLARRRGEALMFPYLDWLPRDRVGNVVGVLWRALAVATLAFTVLALAQPVAPESEVSRIANGANIALLIDRSASMDMPLAARAPDGAGLERVGPSRAEAARQVLRRFVAEREADRMAVMMFGTTPLPMLSFTQDKDAILAAVSGTGIGRGMPQTRLGLGLLFAIERFDLDAAGLAGNRVVILVSDGGARLDEAVRKLIRAGLARNNITLYFIYLRSGAEDLRSVASVASADDADVSEEVELQRFFMTLKTPYRLHQVDDPDALRSVMAEIDAQQKLPIDHVERIPARELGGWLYAAAFACGVLALILRGLLSRSLS